MHGDKGHTGMAARDVFGSVALVRVHVSDGDSIHRKVQQGKHRDCDMIEMTIALGAILLRVMLHVWISGRVALERFPSADRFEKQGWAVCARAMASSPANDGVGQVKPSRFWRNGTESIKLFGRSGCPGG